MIVLINSTPRLLSASKRNQDQKKNARGLSPSIPARPREVASIMRLTQTQQEAIRSGVASVIGAESRIWLFGSRADDSKRGGDIDLFIETDAALPNRVASLCRLEGKLVMSLGERKIDILLKDAQTQESPLHRIAKERGVPL
jgi:predicted nucleotidyltransferase